MKTKERKKGVRCQVPDVRFPVSGGERQVPQGVVESAGIIPAYSLPSTTRRPSNMEIHPAMSMKRKKAVDGR